VCTQESGEGYLKTPTCKAAEICLLRFWVEVVEGEKYFSPSSLKGEGFLDEDLYPVMCVDILMTHP